MDHPPETTSLLYHFAALKDPRQRVKVIYPLPEILLLILCASIAAADDFVEVQHWGETHMDFLRRFLPYKDGIPSHDALNDLMNALDHKLFSECFVTWVNGLREADLDIVSVDGKTSRRSHAKSKGRQALHMVSAWASGQRLVLGQEATDAKSNEITAIPLLLQRLELKGALVTIDAMGCQTKIAATILDRGADYLLAVKDNQPSLHDDIRRYFGDAPAEELETFQTIDGDHGRIETRRHVVSHKVEWLAEDSRFPGIKPSPWSRTRSNATAKPHANAATIFAPSPCWPCCSPTPSAAIGISRTVCTGCWMSSSVRTSHGCAPATARKTWRPFATWS